MKQSTFGIFVLFIIAALASIFVVIRFVKPITPLNTQRMQLESPVLQNNGKIPALYTCDGKNGNPPLVFKDVPASAKSLALVIDDRDVPKTLRPDGVWDHWVVWNIQPTVKGFPENAAPPGILGKSTGGTVGYETPCPPDGEHRYNFTLYALDTILPLQYGATKNELLESMKGHILEQALLVGTYKR